VAENGGIGVGRGSEAGANRLNFWNEKQESESAMRFLRTGMWAAQMIN